MKKNLSHFLFLSCAIVLLTANVNASSLAYKLFDISKNQDDSFKKYISNYSLITLNKKVLNEICQSKSENISIEIPLSVTKVITINLKKSRVFSDGFIISTPEGNVPYTPGLYYHGKIEGIDLSTGSFSFFNSSLMGVISIDRGNYVIGTIDSKNPVSNQYIVYNDGDMVVQNPFECHTDDRTLPTTNFQSKGGDPQVTTTASCRLVELYLECDNKMFLDKGSNVNNVINYVSGFMNQVALIYANESINIAIKQLFVWTTADPYPITSSAAALMAFQSHLSTGFNGDLAHLLSTTASNLGGVSYVDVLCNQSYGVSYSNVYNTYSTIPTYSWTVEVVSHEMGHAFGSQHAHWCGWQLTPTTTGPVDTCYTPEGGCYTGPTKPKTGTIMSYCHLNANISFALGFGPLPGNQIRSRYNAVACSLNPVSGGTVTTSGSGSICTGAIAAFSANASTSGSAYSWTGPAGFTSSIQNPILSNVQVSNAGLYNVTATYTGCTSDTGSASLTVINAPAAVITPIGATNFCVGGSVMLSANTGTGYTYQWKKAGLNIAGATAATYVTATAGNFKVVVTNSIGCSQTSAEVKVTGPASGVIAVSGSLTFCAGGSVTLTAAAGSGFSYQWRINSVNIPGATSNVYTASAAGKYTCVITNAFGCSKVSQVKTVIINCRLSAINSTEISYLVSPNPFVNTFTLNFTDENSSTAQVKIFDVIGKQAALFQNVNTKNGFTGGEALQSGIYFIEVTQGQEKQLIKLVKK